MKCAYCGKEFVPAHPNQRYCGRAGCTADFITARRELKQSQAMDSLFERSD